MESYPQLGLTFLIKVDLEDAYMRIWFRINYIPSPIAFMIPKGNKEEEHLVGFQLSILMGYVESAPFFCAATETLKDMVNNTMYSRKTAPAHPLEKLEETSPSSDNSDANQMIVQAYEQWRNLPARAYQAALAHVEVYVEKFIGIFQGVPEGRIHMTRRLFCSIDSLFRPNNPLDVAREEQITLNKM